MKLTNVLPETGVKTVFLGKDEALDVTLTAEFSDHQVLQMIQTHSDRWLLYDHQLAESKLGEFVYFDDVDALFTDQKRVVLVVKVADCYPIIVAHPQGTIGVIHAGRAGLEQKIVEKSLGGMVEATGSVTGWRVWLGPKICRDCYQVDRATDEHYDLRARVVEQITAVLAKETNYALDSNLCTHHHDDWFYSYRRSGVGVTMNYGLIALGL